MPSVPPPLTGPELPDGAGGGHAAGAVEELPPWRPWTAPAAVALGLALGSIGDIVVSVVGAAGGASLSHPPPAVNIVGNIVFDLGFVAAALYLASLSGGVRLTDFGFRRASLGRTLGILALAAFCYFVATDVYATLLGLHGTEQLPKGLGNPSDTAAMIGVGLFVTVIAPICEEVFFRGFLFGALRSWLASKGGWGTWIAAIITGLLFGAAHIGSAAVKYLIPLAFLGFVLCIVRWKTGSLYPAVAMHSINNAVAFGVDQLHWDAAKIIAMALVALAAVAAIVGPLGAREPAVAVGGAPAGGRATPVR
jgi:membrane protease YdiL (CAAX protease family)